MADNNLSIFIKRFDTTLPLPEYKTSGAAGFDLYAREQTTIAAGAVGYVPLNIAIQLPEGTWAMVAARSSLHKKGLMLANSIGVGDYDFRGDGDEYKAALYNFSNQDVVIERAERIVQMIIMQHHTVTLVEKTSFGTTDRGGFGTTGRL